MEKYNALEASRELTDSITEAMEGEEMAEAIRHGIEKAYEMGGRKKFIIIKQVDTAYWLDEGMLAFAPVNVYGEFSTEEGGIVDDELMKGEPLPEPFGMVTTFDGLYAIVRARLNA